MSFTIKDPFLKFILYWWYWHNFKHFFIISGFYNGFHKGIVHNILWPFFSNSFFYLNIEILLQFLFYPHHFNMLFAIISPKINLSANSVNFGFLSDPVCLSTKEILWSYFFSVIDAWFKHVHLIFLKDFIRRHASIKQILNRFLLFFVLISYLQYFLFIACSFFSLNSFFSHSFITAASTSCWFIISDDIFVFSWTSSSNCPLSDFFSHFILSSGWLFIFNKVFFSFIITFCLFYFLNLPFPESSSNSSFTHTSYA